MKRLLAISVAMVLLVAAPAHAVLVYEHVPSHRIFVARDDGTKRREVAHGYLPALSPSGRQIVFERVTNDQTELWVMRADGTHKRRLLFNAYLDPHGSTRSWSPNSRYVVAGDPSSGGAYIVDLKEHKTHVIGTGNDFSFGGATFAPDSRRAVFEQPPIRGPSNLAVRDAAGRHPHHVAYGDTPLWGAGGLAFHGNAGLKLKRRLSGPTQLIVPSNGHDLLPIDWSPHGHSLLFAREDSGEFDLHAVFVRLSDRQTQLVPKTFSEIYAMSRKGTFVLGAVGGDGETTGDVVRVKRNGHSRVLARKARSATWTK
jgi:WD40 repeat protein